MAGDISIKRATEQDMPLILQFIRELAEFEKLLNRVAATEELVQKNIFGPKPVAHAIIAQVDKLAVGFAVYFFNYSTFSARRGLYVEDVYVRPSHRRSGIGRQIFSFLAAEALENSCARMELAVLNWNDSAISFYQSLGGEPLTDWTVFRFSEDSLKRLIQQ